MKRKSVIVASLHSPREKIWGVLLSINSFGLTLRGIDINSFDDWSRSVSNQAESMGLSTMFIPMIRVEKVTVDETAGGYKSFSDQFQERVGQNVVDYMNIPDEEQ